MADTEKVVQQLLIGVQVKGMDGATVTVPPFTARFAFEMDQLIEAVSKGEAKPKDVARKFFDRYPQLLDVVSPGDVIGNDQQAGIIAGFFWALSGAAVLEAASPAPNGASSGASTPSPTPEAQSPTSSGPNSS